MIARAPRPFPCQKHLFSLDPDVHYLNCAYMGPLPKSVEQAGVRGLQRKRSPNHITAPDFFSEGALLRRRFAELINCPAPERIAILPSASFGLASAARNLHPAKGQNIVLLHEQFPSNVYAWHPFAQQGIELRTVRPPDDLARRGQGWNERLLEAIDRQTAVVAVESVHWADGTRFDLEAVGKRAREVGAALVVDGTQAVGALPFDLSRVQPDALICAGYKWLLGPYSIGLGYFGPRFDDGEPIEFSWMNRQGSEDFSQLVHYQDAYRPGAIRYDVGEHSHFIALPMLIAALEQIQQWGVEAIQAYCQRLSEPLLERVRDAGFWIEDAAWRAGHLFGLRTPTGVDPKTLAQALAARKVFVSVRGTWVRISPHLYNEAADIEALLNALAGAL